MSYTFLSRLLSVRFMPRILSQANAEFCSGREGNPVYFVEWSHYHPPYCLDFQMPENALQRFTDKQKETAEIFRKVGKPETTVRVITRARANLLNYWRLITAMLVPTSAPYPLYDCRFVIAQGNFRPIKEISPLEDSSVQVHHCHRQRGWMKNSPGFTLPIRVLSMHMPAPLTFTNEREYETIKIIELLREAHYHWEIYLTEYNREYTFQLFPASIVHGITDGDLDDFFYGLLDATPRKQS